MQQATKKYVVSFFVALLCLMPALIQAQNEVTRKQNSLKGIQAVGFTVTLEANNELIRRYDLNLDSFQQSGTQLLQEGEVNIIPDKEVQNADGIPFLLMHVNLMELNTGLIPFSISLYLYQPVKLALNRNMRTTAITWESRILGTASYDRTDVIYQASRHLMNKFIADYNKINR